MHLQKTSFVQKPTRQENRFPVDDCSRVCWLISSKLCEAALVLERVRVRHLALWLYWVPPRCCGTSPLWRRSSPTSCFPALSYRCWCLLVGCWLVVATVTFMCWGRFFLILQLYRVPMYIIIPKWCCVLNIRMKITHESKAVGKGAIWKLVAPFIGNAISLFAIYGKMTSPGRKQLKALI